MKMQASTIPPPDPNPVKPKYTPPPGACDGHCHIFGPASRFPYAKDRTYEPPDSPKDKLAALHRHLGFSRAVLVQASCHGTDNSAMLDAIASSNGAWRGVGMVAGDVSEKELRRLHEGGVRGVRFNFVKHLGGMPEISMVEAVTVRIAPLGWHLQLHLDAENIPELKGFLNGLKVPFKQWSEREDCLAGEAKLPLHGQWLVRPLERIAAEGDHRATSSIGDGKFHCERHSARGVNSRAGDPRKVITSTCCPGSTTVRICSGLTFVETAHSAGLGQRLLRCTTWS